MIRWIAHLVGAFGYTGVALLMAVENVVMPIPSEVIMPAAGFDAVGGSMTMLGVIIAGTIGSVLGSVPVYAVARMVGEKRMSNWLKRHGRWFLIDGRDLKEADARFKRHGFAAVAVSQLIPGARALIALPAGFAEMNIFLFLIANMLGTVVWCTALAFAGQQLGAHYATVDRVIGPVGWIVLIALAAGAYAWHRKRAKRGGGR